MTPRLIGAALLCACVTIIYAAEEIQVHALAQLRADPGGHYLLDEHGHPFFALADTGWRLFTLLSPAESERYLDDRASKGFNVIQVFGWGGDDSIQPFLAPLRDDTQVELNTAYWDHVDLVMGMAEARGIYVNLQLGHALRNDEHKNPGSWYWVGRAGVHDSDAMAYQVGWHIANRLKHRSNIIWGFGADFRPTDRDDSGNIRHVGAEDQVRAMAEGVADAVNGLGVANFDGTADYTTTLMSFHPGYKSSSSYFHQDDWLDFNMIQTSHVRRFVDTTLKVVSSDYALEPGKPTLESEIWYEGWVSKHTDVEGYSAYDSRIGGYWSVFAGGSGFSYGHGEVWRFARGEEGDWEEALDAPGAGQMQYLKRLMQSRPMLQRIPDQQVIAYPSYFRAGVDQLKRLIKTVMTFKRQEEVSEPAGTGHQRLLATRANDGSYAFVYTTNGRDVAVHMNSISGKQAQAWWYDPRTGNAELIGFFPTRGVRSFDPPGEANGSDNRAGNDWVLVLDDASRGYGPPGT